MVVSAAIAVRRVCGSAELDFHAHELTRGSKFASSVVTAVFHGSLRDWLGEYSILVLTAAEANPLPSHHCRGVRISKCSVYFSSATASTYTPSWSSTSKIRRKCPRSQRQEARAVLKSPQTANFRSVLSWVHESNIQMIADRRSVQHDAPSALLFVGV